MRTTTVSGRGAAKTHVIGGKTTRTLTLPGRSDPPPVEDEEDPPSEPPEDPPPDDGDEFEYQHLITTNAELNALLASGVSPGDTIAFAEGDYTWINIRFRRWDAPGITLRPAPGANVRIYSTQVGHGPFLLDGVAGLTIRGFELDTFDGIGVMMGGTNPERIHVKNCTIHGAVVSSAQIASKGGVGVSMGLNPVDCSVEDCTIHHVGAGINGAGGSDVVVRGNTIRDINSDAIHMAPGAGLTIEDNEVYNLWATVLAHLDGLQLYYQPGHAPSDITIRRNKLYRGSGTPFQTIFARDNSVPYESLLIEENLVAGGSYHGITVSNAPGAIIRDNYVTGDAGSKDGATQMYPWIKVESSTDVTCAGNAIIGGLIPVSSTFLDQSGNTSLSLPASGDYTAGLAWFEALP